MLAEIRARAWQLGTLLCAALAVAAVIAFLYQRAGAASDRARADAATGRAEALAGQLAEARKALEREAFSVEATEAARESAETRQAEHQERAERVRTIVREVEVTVPAVCPLPDPRLMRELAEGTARLRSAEDRLRGL